MALVTVQRSPTPSASSSPSVSEGGSDDDRRLQQQSLSDSFFTVKGAALFLQQGNSSQVPRCYHQHKYAGDLQLHLQVMINHLRPEDRIKLAVRLESMSAHRVRYMVVVYTNGNQDTEENVLLGIDFASKESNTCTIGLTLPLWSDTKIHLDGDGGFSVSTVDRIHIFKPVSVQAMWSALQILHKSCEIARRYNYYPSGIALTWTSYYESCINSDQSCINEWNAMQDLQSMRADSPPMFVDKPTENELTERLIKNKLRSIMMSKDLENVTSKDIRNELEQQMNCTLKEYKGFIDNEMLIILGQMDKATLIFDHLYLGSEWNASNLEELQSTGKHRHNILWRRNSESGLQETVRDPMLQSSKASTPHDLNRCKAVIQHTCEEQKYNDAETSLNVAVTNKDEIEPVNFNYYFRCLSEPVTDSVYNRQQKELEQLSVQVDNVEKNEIQIDNEDFRCTEDSAHDTRMLASSQLQDSYDNKSRLLGQQGNTLKMSTAVEELEEENENTMNLDMHDQGDHFMVNGPNTENNAEAIANLKGMLEPDSTSSVESQLSKDNVNNNNNTTRNYLKEDEDLTTTETSNSIKPINKFALDCSDSVSNLMCERFMDRSKNLHQVQICSTCSKESQATKSSDLGYLSSGASDVQMTEAFYSVPNKTEMTEKPVNKIDAIYTTDTILLHETTETGVGLRTNCEEQHRKTMVAYHNCKNVTSNFHTEVLVLDAVTSLSDRRQDLKQLPVVSPCMGSHEYQKTLINSNTRFVPSGSKADEQVLQLPEFKVHQSEEKLSQLTRHAATLGNEWDNMAEIMEQSHGTHSLPSSRQPIKDKLVVFPSSSTEKLSAKPKKEMEKSKIQSYLMQHQESILQLQKAGLVRKHTKELERLMFLTSPNSQIESQNFEKRKNIFADRDSLDLTVHEPTVDIQDLTQSYEDMENSVLSEPSYYEFNFMNGLCQKTSTPYINNRNGSGYLTKDRLQQICATLIPSPLTSSLTRSSSSDSLHSIQGQPGLVELRRQEIEARMRQAGLTICSEMKRSHSIAKLGSLTMPNEDLSSKEKEAETFIGSSNIKLDESLLLPNIVEKMKWKSSRCEEIGTQPEQTSIMEPLKSIETSSSILEHKTLPYIQRTDQAEHSCQMFSPPKYSISDLEVTQQFEDFTSVPSSGLSQFHIQSANELCPLASKEQNV
ncbi:protein phosphatase Slingshot homolog 1-like isoform X4 [Chiloscyllium punctatum]|uniref:protein phosphatase Slingshot homolog 1-like isoform X4 n=1 Tax=Chiloscyllium punctatum TaxID=137246 RepID=UPI003B632BD1